MQNTHSVIQVETVRELLLHLDCHKSMGPDGLHPGVLRELAGVIAEPLSYLERSQRIGGLLMGLPSTRRAIRRIWGTTALSA